MAIVSKSKIKTKNLSNLDRRKKRRKSSAFKGLNGNGRYPEEDPVLVVISNMYTPSTLSRESNCVQELDVTRMALISPLIN